MEDIFRRHVEQLHAKYEALMAMSAVSFGSLPREVPTCGIYLFSEGSSHLYVGRSKKIRQRLHLHCGGPAGASFAFKLAREATGRVKATYTSKGSRQELLADPVFAAAFHAAKARIRQMHIRFVEEPDPVRQALLEIYVTIVLAAPYNDFDTH